jgi:hypothetical protein
MTSDQIKEEIQKVLNDFPESVLKDVLDFLKELQVQSPDNIKLTNDLRKILSEDKNLLNRLAK